MYRRLLIGGVTALLVAGAGGTALALTGSGTAGGTPATAAAHVHGHRWHAMLRHAARGRIARAQLVTRGKTGFVTHDLIAGTVTAVSPSSITVHAADGTSQTYAVTKDTRVRTAGDHVPGLSSIAAVHTGDRVVVVGTGTASLTAKHVIDLKR